MCSYFPYALVNYSVPRGSLQRKTHTAGQGHRPTGVTSSILIYALSHEGPPTAARAPGAHKPTVPASLALIIKAASNGPDLRTIILTCLSLHSPGPLATQQPTQAGSMSPGHGGFWERAQDPGFNWLRPLFAQLPVEVCNASGAWRYSTDVAHITQSSHGGATSPRDRAEPE